MAHGISCRKCKGVWPTIKEYNGHKCDIAVGEVLHAGFVTVFKYHFWEIVKTTDSVAVLIFDVRTDQFVFIEQFRPATKFSAIEANNQGMLLEVPAGRFDVNLPVKQLVVKEVKEETGITITENDVNIINDKNPLALSPGILTEYMYLVYVEVDSDVNKFDDSKFFGNKEEKEITKRILLPAGAAIRQMSFSDMKTFALIQWFKANKAAELEV